MKRYIVNSESDSECNFQLVQASRSEGSEDLQAALAHFAGLLNDLTLDYGVRVESPAECIEIDHTEAVFAISLYIYI